MEHHRRVNTDVVSNTEVRQQRFAVKEEAGAGVPATTRHSRITGHWRGLIPALHAAAAATQVPTHPNPFNGLWRLRRRLRCTREGSQASAEDQGRGNYPSIILPFDPLVT